jgi:hypothetical protein
MSLSVLCTVADHTRATRQDEMVRLVGLQSIFYCQQLKWVTENRPSVG